MEVEQILADFERTQTACREMEHNKILVGIVGDVGSDVIKIAHGHEYGDGRLPERSFLRASFDADQNALNQIVTSKNNNAAAIQKDGSYMTFDEDTSEAVTSAMFNKPQTLGSIINPETTLWDSLLTVIEDHMTIDISDIEQLDRECGVIFIKLGEIRKRYPKGIITVISENPLNGVIYQIGNSSSGF